MAQKQIPPLTPEERAAWMAKKTAQWLRVEKALTDTGLNLGMVQTANTFWLKVSSFEGPEFNDEVCFGDPAKSVTRDDRLFNLRSVDFTDEQIDAVIAQWRILQKVPVVPRGRELADVVDRGRDSEGQAARDKRMGRA